MIKSGYYHNPRKAVSKTAVFLSLGFLIFWSNGVSSTVNKKDILNAIRSYRIKNAHSIIREYFEFLSIPNVTADKENIRKNAFFIKKMMEKRGIKTDIIETDGNPVVYGEILFPGAEQTLLFYVHYDGQPVDPAKWTGSLPFSPVLRPGKLEAGETQPEPISLNEAGENFDNDWRIYARSSSDDKAPLTAMMAALDGLKQAGISVRNNIKFILEGEEEAGSPNLGPFLKKNRELLKADVLFMCDGPAYYSGDPTIFFGVRGIVSIAITVYGPNTSLHSGHYGNWAPNPAMRLAKLLATMKDETGKVTVDGFYDTVVPLSEREKKAVRNVPDYEQYIKQIYGFMGTEGGGMTLMEALQLPSLNINGLLSGWVGDQARTVIPPEATASIDIRLVKGCTPHYMLEQVKEHIKKQGYFLVSEDPDYETRMTHPFLAKITVRESGYPAYRISMDIPIAERLADALKDYYEYNPVFLPTLGGSLPIYLFDETLDLPVIGISIVNHDNNQHQPNENLRLGNLWSGIETFAAIFMMAPSPQFLPGGQKH